MKPNRVWVVEYRKSRKDDWRVIETVGVGCRQKAYDHAKNLWRFWCPEHKFRVTPYEPVKRGKR